MAECQTPDVCYQSRAVATLITDHFITHTSAGCSLPHMIGDSNWAPALQCHSRLMLSEGSHWSLWASLSSVSSDVWWQCVMWRSRGLSPDSDSEETRPCAQHIGHSTVFRISHTHNYINEYNPNLYIKIPLTSQSPELISPSYTKILSSHGEFFSSNRVFEFKLLQSPIYLIIINLC